jgi:hypothetical protein
MFSYFVQVPLPTSLKNAIEKISETICSSWPHIALDFVDKDSESAHFALATPEAFMGTVFNTVFGANLQTEVNLRQVLCFCNIFVGLY